jgi:hypothetical protein
LPLLLIFLNIKYKRDLKWSEKSMDNKKQLEQKNVPALRVLATKLEIQGRSNLKRKVDLIREILKKQKNPPVKYIKKQIISHLEIHDIIAKKRQHYWISDIQDGIGVKNDSSFKKALLELYEENKIFLTYGRPRIATEAGKRTYKMYDWRQKAHFHYVKIMLAKK